MVMRFINEKLNIVIPIETIRRILHDRDIMQTIQAQPMEPGRFNLNGSEIHNYFEKLIATISGTPAELVFNVDESGFQEWVDTKHIFACVPPACKEKIIKFPLPRNGKRATMIVGVSLSGFCLKPCLVFTRLTFDTELYPLGYQDKALYTSQRSGFVVQNIFKEWVQQVFIPHIQTVRHQLKAPGTAKLIMDGCRAHISSEIQYLFNQSGIDVI